MKLFDRGKMNKPIVELLCRNSRQPEWLRSDLLALISSCRTAATRVCELCARFGPEVYAASTEILLERTRSAISQLIETHMSDEPSTFVDFVDDDGHGRGPFAIKCTLTKPEKNRLRFDWSGTSPQASSSINFYLSETMFKVCSECCGGTWECVADRTNRCSLAIICLSFTRLSQSRMTDSMICSTSTYLSGLYSNL